MEVIGPICVVVRFPEDVLRLLVKTITRLRALPSRHAPGAYFQGTGTRGTTKVKAMTSRAAPAKTNHISGPPS